MKRLGVTARGIVFHTAQTHEALKGLRLEPSPASLRGECFQEITNFFLDHIGFHDLRRAFATMNAPALSADALQKLMRHKSYTTTQRYINLAGQLQTAVGALHVPAVLKAAQA
jgi:integrase